MTGEVADYSYLNSTNHTADHAKQRMTTWQAFVSGSAVKFEYKNHHHCPAQTLTIDTVFSKHQRLSSVFNPTAPTLQPHLQNKTSKYNPL
jgi:hypothetical protein